MPRRLSTRILAVLGALTFLLVAAWAIDLVIHRDRVSRNVELADDEVGGLGESALHTRVEALRLAYGQSEVVIETDAGTFTTTAEALGTGVDIEATVDAVLDADPTHPLEWIAGLFSSTTVDPVLGVDPEVTQAAVASFDLGSNEAIPPTVDLLAGELVLSPGTPGQAIDIDDLVSSLEEAFDPTGTTVHVNLVTVEPPEPDQELVDLVGLVNATTADGIDVTVGGRTETISADLLRSWLLLDTTGETPSLALSDDSVQAWLDDTYADLQVVGTPATIIVFNGQPGIVGGEPTVTCCGDASPDLLLEAILAGQDEVELEPVETPTERGREWAESLGVIEEVGSFTTNHPSGQPRVQNIHRIADLIQGVLIEPGQTFSVNEFIGPRTAANGFVSAPVIQDGVFSEGVGGGISQFATTLFNAAFFAGLNFGDYQSHSIYISRYPYGREATLSYPSPDLQIVNTTPYGVLVWPSYTESSISVSLYSTHFVDSEQTGQTESPSGAACTRVITERTRTYLDGRIEVDSVRALYRPEGVSCSGEPSRPPTTTAPTAVAPTTTTPTGGPAVAPPGGPTTVPAAPSPTTIPPAPPTTVPVTPTAPTTTIPPPGG